MSQRVFEQGALEFGDTVEQRSLLCRRTAFGGDIPDAKDEGMGEPAQLAQIARPVVGLDMAPFGVAKSGRFHTEFAFVDRYEMPEYLGQIAGPLGEAGNGDLDRAEPLRKAVVALGSRPLDGGIAG